MNSSGVVEALLSAYRSRLVAFAEKRLGSRASAEDVVQQAALRALGHADQLRDPAAGRSWLFQITRRLMVDQLRAPAMVAAEDRDLHAKGSDEAAAFGCACVLANLERLPDAHASILRRAIVDGVSAADIAGELGVSINATAVRLHRARAALRKQLRTHCGTRSLRECLDCPCTSRGCCRPDSHRRAVAEHS